MFEIHCMCARNPQRIKYFNRKRMWTVVDFQTRGSFSQSLFADLNEVQNLNNFEISHDVEAEVPPHGGSPAHAVCRDQPSAQNRQTSRWHCAITVGTALS